MKSRPSLTARAVALARSELARPHTPTGDPSAEARLYGGLRMPARWPLGARLRRWVAARTEFFDEVTLSALQDGIAQVVIVGAGYDARALRFRAPGVRYFEVDHPSTQQDKRRRLAEIGAAPDAAVHIPHDLLSGELPGALAAAGHSQEHASLFICEGLLLYLDRATIERLLAELRSSAAPGSRLALNAGERLPGAPAATRARAQAQRLLLAAIGEPRRSLLEPGELGELLARTGWRAVREHAVARTPGQSLGLLVLAEAVG